MEIKFRGSDESTPIPGIIAPPMPGAISARNIAITRFIIEGHTYKEAGLAYNISASRCRYIARDVQRRTLLSDGQSYDWVHPVPEERKEIHLTAINRYVERTTHRVVATCAPNRFGDDFILHGEFINWGYLLYVLLYYQMPDGTWTLPARDYVERKYLNKNCTCQNEN